MGSTVGATKFFLWDVRLMQCSSKEPITFFYYIILAYLKIAKTPLVYIVYMVSSLYSIYGL